MTENIKIENLMEGNEKYYRFVIQELDHLLKSIEDPEYEDLEDDIRSVFSRIKDLKGDYEIIKDLTNRWSGIATWLTPESSKLPEATRVISEFKDYISKLK